MIFSSIIQSGRSDTRAKFLKNQGLTTVPEILKIFTINMKRKPIEEKDLYQ